MMDAWRSPVTDWCASAALRRLASRHQGKWGTGMANTQMVTVLFADMAGSTGLTSGYWLASARHLWHPAVGEAPKGTVIRSAMDAFNRQFTSVHTWTYIKSGGWLGHYWTLSPPSLLLHATGRKSGIERSVALVYATDGDSILIVGSNFGQDRPPAWLLNLEAKPAAEINLGHRRLAVVADIVEPSDARYPRLFGIANEKNKRRYDRYTGMTERSIPVVVLSSR